MQIDLNCWLDLLLSRDFGDIEARLVVFFRYRSTWFGLLRGYSNDEQVLP